MSEKTTGSPTDQLLLSIASKEPKEPGIIKYEASFEKQLRDFTLKALKAHSKKTGQKYVKVQAQVRVTFFTERLVSEDLPDTGSITETLLIDPDAYTNL